MTVHDLRAAAELALRAEGWSKADQPSPVVFDDLTVVLPPFRDQLLDPWPASLKVGEGGVVRARRVGGEMVEFSDVASAVRYAMGADG